ncbi:hypothetical protein B0T19DRAFT_45651 [Cercophora scortea]|uniref:Rhodopsin domain-containing protein n=1 Tax=Cercophora scortea TaxID=314031 RepID=A0AAE0J509_9PEZI|nr:hypothetical protein B0T19DRAFT_45651 [Cercophora scortea]
MRRSDFEVWLFRLRKYTTKQTQLRSFDRRRQRRTEIADRVPRKKTRMAIGDYILLPPEEDAAFALEPAGPVPYSGLQMYGFFVVVVFTLLSLVVCGMRVYSKRLSSGFGIDDWLILIAMVLAIPQAICEIIVIRTGYWGIHDQDIPPHPINQGLFWNFFAQILYNPCLALVKISALIFLSRLGDTKTRVRLACRAMIGFNMLQVLGFLPATILQCSPVEYQWLFTPGGHCVDGAAFSLAMASTNIVTDVLTLLIPFWIFLDLKVTKRVRYALLTVFLLGIAVTAISIMRLGYVIRAFYRKPQDVHFSLGLTANTLEIDLAIITASAPALWPLARRWFPDVFQSLGINRPFLYPDIEVLGDQSQASRRQSHMKKAGRESSRPGNLRVKVSWVEHQRAPSRAAEDGEGSLASDIREREAAVFKKPASIRSSVSSLDAFEVRETYHGMLRPADTARESRRGSAHSLLGSR